MSANLKRTKSVSIQPKKKTKVASLQKYNLAYVVDGTHKKQVLDNVNVRKVTDETTEYEHVRRNKKFMKIQKIKESGEMKLKEIISAKKNLDVVNVKFQGKEIYSPKVIEILKNPEKFKFEQCGDVWKVHVEGKEVLSSDFTQQDLLELKPDLEKDMGVLEAASKYICSNKLGDAVLLNSHPGHHAGLNQVANYCAINNAIVSAALIKKEKPKARIGILDLDAHPGDGTKQFVEKNKELVARYVSLHGEEEFINMETFKKKENAVVMHGKISWKTYDKKLQKTLQSLRGSDLDVLLVCIGFDTLKDDPNGGKQIGFQLLPLHFRKIGAHLGKQPTQVVLLQEGGYDCNLSADAFQHLLEGFHAGRKIHAIDQI